MLLCNYMMCKWATVYQYRPIFLKEDILFYAFVLFPFPLVSYIVLFVHVKDLQSYKAQSPGQRMFLSPTETLLMNCLKHLDWSPAFSSRTLWCHQVTHLHNTCIMTSLARPKTMLVRVELERCPKSLVWLTNQSRLGFLCWGGGGGGGMQELKQSVSDRMKKGAAAQTGWEK